MFALICRIENRIFLVGSGVYVDIIFSTLLTPIKQKGDGWNSDKFVPHTASSKDAKNLIL